MARFRGRDPFVECDDGYSVEIVSRASYPAATLRYREANRTMDDDREAVDGGTRRLILDRIKEALAYAGYQTDLYPGW